MRCVREAHLLPKWTRGNDSDSGWLDLAVGHLAEDGCEFGTGRAEGLVIYVVDSRIAGKR
jgi:hypothetical protein